MCGGNGDYIFGKAVLEPGLRNGEIVVFIIGYYISTEKTVSYLTFHHLNAIRDVRFLQECPTKSILSLIGSSF